jgi:hypothetical protein
MAGSVTYMRMRPLTTVPGGIGASPRGGWVET